MSPGTIVYRIVADRLSWIESMISDIQVLPLQDFEEFAKDKRNIGSAESCLRRALEALLDLGRHILAKGFAQGVTEYREIPQKLLENGLLGENEAKLMKKMAGYRNRLVHFYHEVSAKELFDICRDNLDEIELVTSALKKWIKANPEKVDKSL
jgi:uncharacterized protein YutE (UPF0331/DUF86 family)